MNKRKYWLGQVGDFEIKQLRVFNTVVSCGGFSAAESELNVTRSTISIHIANLEARLNLKLCHRGRGGFALTEEGRIIYEQSQKLFATLEEFRSTVNNLNATLAGDLRLVFSDTVTTDSRLNLPELIDELNQLAPDVYVTVQVTGMADIEQMLINEEAEIGFLPYHRSLDGLEYMELFSDRCYLYCHRKNPLFDVPDDQLTDELINAQPVVQAGLKPNPAVESQIRDMELRATAYHYEARLALIRSGRYIAFLPEQYAAPAVEAGELRALQPDTRHYPLALSAVVRHSARKNKARDLFLSLLRERFINN